jgi:hypothetical protein
MRIKKSNSNDKYLGKLKITEKISELLLTLSIKIVELNKNAIKYWHIINKMKNLILINKIFKI